jgi:hypothetical protein
MQKDTGSHYYAFILCTYWKELKKAAVVTETLINITVPFENFVDWHQCAPIMQREAVTVMPSCSGEGNIVVA